MKNFYRLYCLAWLLACWGHLTAQQLPPSSFQFEEGTPQSWWEVSTAPRMGWRVGVPDDSQLGEFAQLFLQNPASPHEDLAVMTTGAYRLPAGEQRHLSLNLHCSLAAGASAFSIELWADGTWHQLFHTREPFRGQLAWDLATLVRREWKLKFVYLSDKAARQEEFIGIADITFSSPSAPVSSSPLVFVAYPNPFRDYLSLRFPTEETGQARYEVLDLQGQVLQAGALKVTKGSNEAQLSFAALARGTYVLRIELPHTTYRQTVIKH